MNSGARTIAALGHTSNQVIIPKSTVSARRKSTIGTVAPARGSRIRGKYTFVTNPRFETRLPPASATADAKYVQGSSAEYVKIGYGTLFDGKLAKRPKMNVKTTIVRNGCTIAHATPIDVCL